jgi:hypothetical protein
VRGLNLALLAALVVVSGNAAQANVTSTPAGPGYWSILSGLATDGKPTCGVSTSFPAGGMFLVKWHQGVNNVFIQIYKSGWVIPPNASVDVSIKFDQAAPWTGKATQAPNGTGIEMSIPTERLGDFLNELRLSNGMVITYPTGAEPPWIANMTGSNRASIGMGACYRAYNPSTTPPVVQTQPYGAAPSPQPYSVAPPPQAAPTPVQTMPRLKNGYEAI